MHIASGRKAKEECCYMHDRKAQAQGESSVQVPCLIHPAPRHCKGTAPERGETGWGGKGNSWYACS